MNCNQLAERIQDLQPEAMPRDVARLCLLLSNFVDDVGTLDDDALLTDAWQSMGMRLQLATDQHEAMTQELEELAQSDPKKFSQDQIWILLRAIKVQSQILQMYVGKSAIDV